ncbi:MAG: methylmalonyl Co-A mutase-associated GTPase MeaB [Candidatus Aminicenantes bacterium]|nr:methylmalonyl Co-A mutase-associated GTPase MeaB [Candidatus Aminicenantes bacterium]
MKRPVKHNGLAPDSLLSYNRIMRTDDAAGVLAQKIRDGEMRSVARGISLVENGGPGARELMKVLFPYTGRSVIIGVTGAPGAGKSTLVDQLIGRFCDNGDLIGVIAVDPSSPFTGGAILGDRIRMMRHSGRSEVYIRSMATRGHLGGLAKATGEAIGILEAAGKNVILIETVGVGQDEVEVVKMADIILVTLLPGAGDDIQAFKAGIMEIADIFVLNKADSPEIDRADRHLRAMLDLGLKDRPVPEVVRTVAITGEGMDELFQKTMSLFSSRDSQERLERKETHIRGLLRDIISERLFETVLREIDSADFESYIRRIFEREIDPYTVADIIIARLKEAS